MLNLRTVSSVTNNPVTARIRSMLGMAENSTTTESQTYEVPDVVIGKHRVQAGQSNVNLQGQFAQALLDKQERESNQRGNTPSYPKVNKATTAAPDDRNDDASLLKMIMVASTTLAWGMDGLNQHGLWVPDGNMNSGNGPSHISPDDVTRTINGAKKPPVSTQTKEDEELAEQWLRAASSNTTSDADEEEASGRSPLEEFVEQFERLRASTEVPFTGDSPKHQDLSKREYQKRRRVLNNARHTIESKRTKRWLKVYASDAYGPVLTSFLPRPDTPEEILIKAKVAVVHEKIQGGNEDEIKAAVADLLSSKPDVETLKHFFEDKDLPAETSAMLRRFYPDVKKASSHHHVEIFNHCDPMELIEIVQLFSPELQIMGAIKSLGEMVAQIISDSQMTDEQKDNYRRYYLQSFKDRFHAMTPVERSLLGLKAAASGGPFGLALYLKQLEDAEYHREMSSLTVEEIEGIEIGGAMWQALIAFVPYVGEATMLINAGFDIAEAVKQGKTDICEYIKDGLTIILGARSLRERLAIREPSHGGLSAHDSSEVFEEHNVDHQLEAIKDQVLHGKTGKMVEAEHLARRSGIAREYIDRMRLHREELIAAEALEEKLFTERDEEYKKKFACRPRRSPGYGCRVLPEKTLVDKLNKDLENKAGRWGVTNAVAGSIRAALLDGSIQDNHFFKAYKLLLGSNRFEKHTELFKLSEAQEFDFKNPPASGGFLNGVLNNNPQVPMHTMYVGVGEGGEMTLFTSDRTDLTRILVKHGQPKAAAKMLAYEITPELEVALKEWEVENGYALRWTPAAEFSQSVTDEISPDVNGYEHQFMQEYRVGLQDSKLVINGHGSAALTVTPDGLMTAKNMVNYLRENHQSFLDQATLIDLRTCESGRGGAFASQAQVIANELNIPVIGYKGKINMRGQSLEGRRNFKTTYTPQHSDQHGLARTFNSMLGDVRRRVALREHPDWKHGVRARPPR